MFTNLVNERAHFIDCSWINSDDTRSYIYTYNLECSDH